MARPSSFTEEIANEICAQLIEGSSLRTICKAENMPSVGTVCRWLTQNEEFQEQYARAREFQADILADEIMDIADDGSNDWMEKHDNEGNNIGWQLNGEHVQRSRLRIDSRKWAASKLKPKKYGDKSSLELAGVDGQPIEIKSKPDDELNKRILELAAKTGAGGVIKAS